MVLKFLHGAETKVAAFSIHIVVSELHRFWCLQDFKIWSQRFVVLQEVVLRFLQFAQQSIPIYVH